MPTQRPLTTQSSVKRISSHRASTNRPSNRSTSLTRTSLNNQTKQNTVGRTRAPAYTEKQIAQRREKEQQNLAKWQKIDKYFRENKARLEQYEQWNQRDLRRTKSTGSHLNQCGLGTLDRFDSRRLNDQQLVGSRSNQQLDDKIENQLRSELINELYIIDPRKIPYDIDVDLLRKPDAVDKLRVKVQKQENVFKKLKERCLQAKKQLEILEKQRTSLLNDKTQLEHLYLEYSKDWLADCQRRFNRLELNCCDEELIFPARKGQLKGKDRLRLRNNLVSEQFDRCRQLLVHVRKLSGHHKMKNLTGGNNRNQSDVLSISLKRTNKQIQVGDDCDDRQESGAVFNDNRTSNLEFYQQKKIKKNSNNNGMQSHLMQLLTDDERQVLESNVMRTTISMLDTYTTLIKRRASLYTALYDEEAKSVWKNETFDLRERVRVCITLMNKIYQLYVEIYREKIEFLNKQIKNANSELENQIQSYDDTLDKIKQNPAKQLVLSLIDKSLLTFTK